MTTLEQRSASKRALFENPELSDLVLDTAVCRSGEPETGGNDTEPATEGETEPRRLLAPDIYYPYEPQ